MSIVENCLSPNVTLCSVHPQYVNNVPELAYFANLNNVCQELRAGIASSSLPYHFLG